MFDTLSDKFSEAFKNLSGKGKITESNIEEVLKQVRTSLLEADVHFKVVKEFVAKVKEEALGEKVIKGVNPEEQFIKIIHDQLVELLGKSSAELELERENPMPILIVGLNGAGKTTFTGKLALYLRNKRKKDVYLIPADNFRPAAKDQLITHAKNLSIDYFDSDLSLSAADIVKAGMAEAKKLQKDIVIVDTAGRLQIDDELMGQLEEVKNVIPRAETLLVADAMTGQEAVNVAKTFHERVDLDGICLSKMDSDARGGAALSINYVTGLPIKFISVGEKMKDLEIFHPDRLAGRILDMGDVVTLVERAQEVIDEEEAEKMMTKMEKNTFSIEDFLKQMEMISKLGSMGSLLKMIPGMGGAMKQIGDIGQADSELKTMKVMIGSMTAKERRDDKLLDDSRIGRIARGSGRTEKDVRDFIKKFREMRKMMSGMMGMMKGGKMPFGLPGMPDMGLGDGMDALGGPSKKGFRQKAGGKQKAGKKGKGKGPFKNRFF